MKYFIYPLLFVIISCYNKKIILVPTIKGKIYSKIDKKPISGVKIFGCKYFINSFDTISTQKDGRFIVVEYTSVTNDPRLESKDISYGFLLKKNQEYKYIDTNKYYKGEYFDVSDTIDLGVIYFEDLKSINKDSITE